MKIVEAYLKWARGEAKRRVLVVYDTMWGSTEKMAKAFIEGISNKGVEAMLFRLPFSDRGDILKELLEAKGIVIGSSTINNGVIPTVAPFLEELAGLKPRSKVAAVFGSYGWGGGAVKTIETKLGNAGIEIMAPSLTAQWVPDEDELKKCRDLGEDIAKTVLERT